MRVSRARLHFVLYRVYNIPFQISRAHSSRDCIAESVSHYVRSTLLIYTGTLQFPAALGKKERRALEQAEIYFKMYLRPFKRPTLLSATGKIGRNSREPAVEERRSCLS